MVRPTINSEKHVVQIGFNNSQIGAVSEQKLVQVSLTPTAAFHIRQGAVVKAVYVELWFQGEGMGTGTSIAIIEKTMSDKTSLSVADMLDLNGYNNKKNVLWTHQGLSSDMNTNAVPVLRGWLKIPKGKQRFSLGDRLDIRMLGQVDGFNFCGLAIFKEYF